MLIKSEELLKAERMVLLYQLRQAVQAETESAAKSDGQALIDNLSVGVKPK